jgi:hypothetical protein
MGQGGDEMTKEEKEVFNKIWRETQRGNKIYRFTPADKKIIDAFVTKGLFRYLSEKYIKFTSEGLKLGTNMNSRCC